PTSERDELDDALDRSLGSGRVGTLATPGNWYDLADTSKDLAAQYAIAGFPATRPIQALRTAQTLREIDELANSGKTLKACASASKTEKLVGIGPYAELKELTKAFEGEIQAHHLIEQRHLLSAGFTEK